MTIEAAVETTLRDTISAAYDDVEKAQPAPIDPATPAAPEKAAATETKEAKAPETKEGRTAGRARDEAGRLLPGKAEKEPAKESAAATAQPDATRPDKGQVTEPAAAPTKPYPSSWKKDYAEKWGALPPEVQDEIIRREGDYAKGVSTYKTEYDRIKPIDDALKQYQPFLQHAGLRPEQFVQALAGTDQVLRYGTPDQKLQAFARFAQDYQIPLHQLLIQGDDGKVYLNQQYFKEQQQPAQQSGISPQEIDRMVQQRMAEAERGRQIREFMEAKDTAGNPAYPHFERVKGSMDGLLRSGLYKDLPSAYKASLRLPEHAELYEAELTAKREAEDKAKAAEKAAAAARARASTVSTRSQSPTGTVASGKTGTGLRDTIADAFEQHAGSSRV